MKRIRIIHRLRVALALLGFLAAVAAGVALWWLNATGLPESWRDQIEDTLASYGVYAEVASLTYVPLRGIEADEVIIYSDQAHTRTLARLNEVLLDIDRSQLTHGKVKIERLELSGARISLAINPDNPESKTLDIKDVRGRLLMPGGRRLEIQGASGEIGGVHLQFDGDLLMYRPRHVTNPEDIAKSLEQRRKILEGIIDAVDHWGPESDDAPLIQIRTRGDLEDPSSIRSTIAIQGHDLKSGDFEIQQLKIDAEMRGSKLVLHRMEVRSANGEITGRMEYDMSEPSGRFEANASIDPNLRGLILNLNLPLPDELPGFKNTADLECRGSFAKTGGKWNYQLIGHGALEQPSFRQFTVDHLASSFSWDGTRLFLEDLAVEKDGNSLSGRLFVTPEIIRYEAKTSLPLPFWQEVIPFQPLKTILGEFSSTGETKISADFQGTANPKDKTAWTFIGQAEASNISYRGVPAIHARTDLDLNSARLDFTNGEVQFDYRDYRLRRRRRGPVTGNIKVDRIRYAKPASTITIDNIRGKAWPAPIIRTFATGLADHVEQYGFYEPPELQANGLIGIRDGISKQNLKINFSTKNRVDYEFADEELVLIAPEAQLQVLPKRVIIRELSCGLCDGLIRSDLTVHTMGRDVIEGEIDWTNLDLPQLASIYGSDEPPKGKLTGRLEFDMLGGNVRGLNGKGHAALNDGELFDVPVFGPLSTVISTVLGNRAIGFQEATDAFCNIQIRKGILATQDFLTTTPSLVFTGDALLELEDLMLEMTVRMNARGFLGIITLPLRPFYGLFQFRGTGPFRNPEWKNVMFTSPPKDQNDALLAPPKARAVAPPPKR